MHRLSTLLLRYRLPVVLVALALTALGAFFALRVSVTYDLTEYLPATAVTRASRDALEPHGGAPGTAQLMVGPLTLPQARSVKSTLLGIDGVAGVLWLDDFCDLAQPVELQPPSLLEVYYQNGNALFTLTFEHDDNHPDTLAATQVLQAYARQLGYPTVALRGDTLATATLPATLGRDIALTALAVVLACLVLLTLAGSSWIEPALCLVLAAIAVAINLGLNAATGSLSLISHGLCYVLQIALSLDYALAILRRYQDERALLPKPEAIAATLRATFAPVSAGALTTIVSFLALLLMRYAIGMDIALVLARGIAISFVTVLVLMPAMLYWFDDALLRTRHRPLVPPFARLGNWTVRRRKFILPAALLLILPALLAQHAGSFVYDTTAPNPASQAGREAAAIERVFGPYHPVTVLIPDAPAGERREVALTLQATPGVAWVQSDALMADAVGTLHLPESLSRDFTIGPYTRFVVNLRYAESPAMYDTLNALQTTLQARYPDQWLMMGAPAALADIQATARFDHPRVIVGLLLVITLVLILSFSAWLLPVLLVGLVLCAAWLNTALPYFQGHPSLFLAVLIVGVVMIGTTINPAILLATRYCQNRKRCLSLPAAVDAVSVTGPAVALSAALLGATGLCLYALGSTPTLCQIGLLLGRGSLLSGTLVLFVLPGLLVLCDKAIARTTRGGRTWATADTLPPAQDDSPSLPKEV